MNLPAFILWVVIFSIFTLGFLWPRGKRDWYSAGLVEGFLISLFFEMFGIPLTVYVLSTVFGFEFSSGSETTFLGAQHYLRIGLIIVFLLLIIGGFLLIVLGWKHVHGGKGQLVTDGIYAYLRHPQYLGIMMVTLGLFIWWPTIITAVMWPILAFMYLRLAKREEKNLREKFGIAYDEYSKEVNMFIPFRRTRTRT